MNTGGSVGLLNYATLFKELRLCLATVRKSRSLNSFALKTCDSKAVGRTSQNDFCCAQFKFSSLTGWHHSYYCRSFSSSSTDITSGFIHAPHGLSYHLSANIQCLTLQSRFPLHVQQVRMKSKKRQGPRQDNSDSESDDDDALAPDDFHAPAKFKVMKIHTASMRTDAIISNSLDVSRNRLEEMFYGPGLLLNGEKMLKKSVKMEEGDYVDLVVDKVEDQLKVKRVKIIKVYSGKTNTDKLNVKVRVWKAPFLINNPDDGRRSS